MNIDGHDCRLINTTDPECYVEIKIDGEIVGYGKEFLVVCGHLDTDGFLTKDGFLSLCHDAITFLED